MQQRIWALAAADALSAGREVDVLTIGPADAPVAFAPLSSSSDWLGRLRLLGAEELGEAVEVFYRDEKSLTYLAEAIAATGRPVGFGHYLVETPFIEALRRAYLGRGIVITKPLEQRANPRIVLDQSWQDPEARLSSGRRSDLRRMMRNAAKMGEVTTDILTPEPSAVPALLDEAFAIEQKGWKGRSGTAVQLDMRSKRFFGRYGVLAAEKGILRICFLSIGGQRVAMELGVETEGSFWLFKIGYDEEFRRCSPGNLLLCETIRYAAKRGLESFELLGKEAPWTTLWTDLAEPVTALRTYPYNIRGAVALAIDAGSAIRQQLERRWRGALGKGTH